ncbi:hypothetical protein G6R29_03610 [Fructobacillus sp. M2-14]|uniref:Uncharacterized protein n=1 Tax=Fructobacillus broussonetiae TaxID=2713173 RepID=A0ABS5QZY2_9LACO|nr:hypothetical protein [Fructobacillus broussonetiae]MBS9338715.1 hypothetical protein [Fructobacillus broussonetiae]
MKVTTVYTAIIALVLLFISVVSWVFRAMETAILTAELASFMLLVVYLWDNRKNGKD